MVQDAPVQDWQMYSFMGLLRVIDNNGKMNMVKQPLLSETTKQNVTGKLTS